LHIQIRYFPHANNTISVTSISNSKLSNILTCYDLNCWDQPLPRTKNDVWTFNKLA